jgi:Holliday junction DNA helicase RuvA
MIARLTGRIVEQEPDGGVVLDVGGVGYDVAAPLGAVGRLVTEADGRVTFHVHTHVREDTFALYGFASRSERETFRSLIAVSNVGPRIALALLSSLSAAELSRAVARADVAALVKIPGIGKRTAERLVLELKGKLDVVPEGPNATSATPNALPPGTQAEVLVSTLTRMGFRPAEAERAVQALGATRVAEGTLSDLVREALVHLSR